MTLIKPGSGSYTDPGEPLGPLCFHLVEVYLCALTVQSAWNFHDCLNFVPVASQRPASFPPKDASAKYQYSTTKCSVNPQWYQCSPSVCHIQYHHTGKCESLLLIYTWILYQCKPTCIGDHPHLTRTVMKLIHPKCT